MSNPLVDRILNNPLTFVSAKHPESEKQSDETAGYIVLKSNTPPTQVGSMLSAKKARKSETSRPKSVAEALAAYTGKKYSSKADKRHRSMQQEQPAASPSSSDTQYESASEFYTDSSFRGFRDSSEASDGDGGDGNEDVGEDVDSEHKPEMQIAQRTGDAGAALAPEMEQSDGSDADEDDSGISKRIPSTDTDEGVHGDDNEFNDNEVSEEDDDDDDDQDDEDYEEDKDFDGDASHACPSDTEPSSDTDKHKARHRLSQSSDGNSTDRKHVYGKDCTNSDDDADADDKTEEHMQLKHDLLADIKQAEAECESQSTQQRHSPIPSSVDSHYSLQENDSGDENGILRKWSGAYKNRKPVGLLNFGVTCYMNSAIQIMVHIPAVQYYLSEVAQGKHKQLKPKSVTHVFAELALKMWGLDGAPRSGGRKYINPKRIVQRLEDINCMMSEWQQEDSHEYFMSLMSRLQEDSTPKGKKLNESVVYDIFGGLLYQEVICQECKTNSVTKQEFYDLSLGLNKKRVRSNDDQGPEPAVAVPRYTIEKSLKDFFSTETIRLDKQDGSSGYFCEKCKKRTVATKKSAIERSPETLMIHLKRFKFNGNSSSKVKHPIHYPKFLDLGPYSRDGAPIKYQLMGVIVHEGRSISSGHYVAHCLQPDSTWSTYDDEYINRIDERQALSDPSAYCLVYMKLTPKTRKRSGSDDRKGKRTKTA